MDPEPEQPKGVYVATALIAISIFLLFGHLMYLALGNWIVRLLSAAGISIIMSLPLASVIQDAWIISRRNKDEDGK